jgi:hypothetical protein
MEFFAGLITGVVLGTILVAMFWESSEQFKNK